MNKATLRVFALAITAVMCTLMVLSAIAPFPEASQWNFLSIGIGSGVHEVLAQTVSTNGMAYALVNKSGCGVFKGNVQIRLDFYLEKEDKRYSDTTDGLFHSHFVYFDADFTEEDIKAAIDIHLGNFYKAFQDGWDAIDGGMRHGWATETRITPIDYSKSETTGAYNERIKACQSAVDALAAFTYKPDGNLTGQTYPATAIDVGHSADAGTGGAGASYTRIDTFNPANDSGTIDTVEIYAFTGSPMGGTKVGTFYGSGTSYTNRDGVTIGTVAAGSKQTFTGLSCNVSISDLIGTYFASGAIFRANTGGTSTYLLSGDKFGAGTQTYALELATRWLSLYATGATISVVAPTVTTQAATNIISTSCTGNGNITATGGENATTRGFCYMVGQAGDPTTANSTAYDTGSYGIGTYSKSITGLSASTYYRVRAYAINSAGTGYGTTVQVTTLPGNPSALTDVAHGGTSINLTWTKGTGADITSIWYRTDQYPTTPGDGTQAYYNTGTSTSVGSLSYGQIYYFRAWAYNSTTDLYSAGTSDKSAFTDPNAPTAFTVTEVTCNCSIALNWTKGTGADKTRIQYRNDQYPTTYTDGTQAYFDTGTSTNVTSLACNQTYYIRAWSYDTESGYYDSYAELTQDTIMYPIAITQDASNINQTTTRINGKISDDGGETCEARFRWRINHGEEGGTEEQTNYNEASQIYDVDNRAGQRMTVSDRWVSNLSFPVRKYGSPSGNVTFSIRKVLDDSVIASKVWGDANSLSGTLAWEEVSFDDAVFVNEEVRILVEFSGTGSIFLGFQTSNVKGGEKFTIWGGSSYNEVSSWDTAYSYDYEYKWTTTDWQNTLITDSIYHEDLTGLTAGTQYEYQTQARNCAGDGSWSTSEYFETEPCSPSISLNVSSWSINGGSPVVTSSNYASGLTYFRITNNSGGAVTITISGTDMTGGGYTWDLDDNGSPGNMIYALKAGLDGGDYTIIVRETATYNTLVAGLDNLDTQDFGLKIWTPTVFSDGNVKSGNITLSVVCD